MLPSYKMRKISLVILLTAATVCITLLYKFYDPTHSIFAPKCPFYLFTGYQCPSCGVQRAVHALLNGDIKVAFWHNPFLAFAIPYILLLVLTSYAKSGIIAKVQQIARHKYMLYGYIVLFFIWWVVRNTKWWHIVSDHFL